MTIPASKDNTLFESATGHLSNGAGSHLFVGRTAPTLPVGQQIRRTAIAFDIADALPAGAQVTAVRLTLVMNRTIVGPMDATVHRITSDWGEGASDAGGQEGRGISSEPGDTTWIHAFFPDSDWGAEGGDFDAAIATTSVDLEGPYDWSSDGMVADVQSWLDDPDSNFGWMILGDESEETTAKRFGSRDGAEDERPSLEIEFEIGVDPAKVPAGTPWGFVILTLALVGGAAVVLRQHRLGKA